MATYSVERVFRDPDGTEVGALLLGVLVLDEDGVGLLTLRLALKGEFRVRIIPDAPNRPSGMDPNSVS